MLYRNKPKRHFLRNAARGEFAGLKFLVTFSTIAVCTHYRAPDRRAVADKALVRRMRNLSQGELQGGSRSIEVSDANLVSNDKAATDWAACNDGRRQQ